MQTTSPSTPRRRTRPQHWLIAVVMTLVTLTPQALAAGVTLQVYAASSLTEAFEDVARAFEAAHPGVAVQLTFAGSQALRLQIEHGARADVFASADERHMRALETIGDVVSSVSFVRNDLVVIVPHDDPAGVTSFLDLPRARSIVIGTESVPIGAATRAVLERAGEVYGGAFRDAVLASVVSEESNARLVRAKVELGEADAAFVYRTDAATGSGVRTIEIPAEANLSSAYLIGGVVRSPRAEVAERFIAFVLSTEGRALLAARGFDTTP